MGPLQLWGGVEPTVNRIADSFGNQLRRSRHWDHPEDLALFADLGLQTLRHPLLWELVAPDGLKRADWTWFDQRFALMQQLGIRPIAGLLHHGSGPRHTSLVSPDFASGMESFARACAERYPWIDDYTPINEPLTTARFSALYGLWYPHAKDDAQFCRALVNQCRATVLAMKQIRRVNPGARLVQTEDLGFVSTTPALADCARFENERRWLTWDLLGGRVNRQHPFWGWLQKGVSEAELQFFLDQPCPPDVLGLNYYITSDRTLDDRLHLYPPEFHGGNAYQRYADIESVRTEFGILGHEELLMQAWERYRKPLAITEVHLDATREEQLRWLHQAWTGAQAARARGADVEAVTIWALLGAFDWNSLLTRQTDYYEAGAFDLRAPKPRPTAIARMARVLATQGTFHHPVLEGPGWWERDERSTHNRQGHALRFHGRFHYRNQNGRPLLITGATGTLGQAFAHACEIRGLGHRLLTRSEMDIADEGSVERAIERLEPWAIINTAGYVRVKEAEREPQRCLRENTIGPKVLASAAEQHRIPLVTFSSDLVFDGSTGRPYVESDPVSPETVYGFTKAEAERCVLKTCEQSLVIRTSAFFGPSDAYNFVTRTANRLRLGKTIRVTADEVISPTYVPDLVRITFDLLLDEAWGVWHLANVGVISWADFGRRVAERLSFSSKLVVEEEHWVTPARPRCLALLSERAVLMPGLDDALDRYLEDVGPGGLQCERSLQVVQGT
jgi:dTDP-4-dehydrorhamnose reductase